MRFFPVPVTVSSPSAYRISSLNTKDPFVAEVLTSRFVLFSVQFEAQEFLHLYRASMKKTLYFFLMSPRVFCGITVASFL